MVAVLGLFEKLSYRKDIEEEKGRLFRSRASVCKYRNDKLEEYKMNSAMNPRQLLKTLYQGFPLPSWQSSP